MSERWSNGAPTGNHAIHTGGDLSLVLTTNNSHKTEALPTIQQEPDKVRARW